MNLDLRKPRPKLLDKRTVARAVAKIDRDENTEVKKRSGGQCEVYEPGFQAHIKGVVTLQMRRCHRRASHIHHLISGIGRRNRGVSILAEHKLHVCITCHKELHGHVLTPVDGTKREIATEVRYERTR